MVELALKRPYTFIVMAMLIALAAPFALPKMATDIFPEIHSAIAITRLEVSKRSSSFRPFAFRICAPPRQTPTSTRR